MSEERKDFADAKRRLQDIQRADENFIREMARRCDWENEEDRGEYRRDVHSEERRRTLNILVPDRKCPVCHKMVLESRKWVVSTQRNMAMCRRCFHGVAKTATEKTIMEVKLFPATETRYRLDNGALALARAKSGLCIRAFAERAGWSFSYQRKLESSAQTIGEPTASAILEVLRNAGVVTQDLLQ